MLATIKEHNNLIKICFDGSKHLNHVLSNEEVKKMTLIESRFPLTKLPVCGHCEQLAMWSRNGTAACRNCGTITKNPITYSSYLASGYDIDATGQTAKNILEDRSRVSVILPEYGKVN